MAVADWFRHKIAKRPQSDETPAMIGTLPETLEYSGEFGPELVCFVPFVYWLYSSSLLGRRKVRSYSGMQPFYWFLSQRQFEGKRERRRFVRPAERNKYLPNPVEHLAVKSPYERFPDYRAVYAGRFPKQHSKPLLIVANKHCNEWDLGPINFIPVDILDRVFEQFSAQYQIVYVREGQGVRDMAKLGFSADHNEPRPFDDDGVLRRHPDVISFQELAHEYRSRFTYNQLKLMLYSDCRHFICSQGGGSHMCALLPGIVLLVMHRCGFELKHSYANGFYRYAANPAPTLLVARNNREFVEALPIFERARSQEEIAADARLAGLLQAMDPIRMVDPHHSIARPAEW